jgi:hypothetical protein
MFGVSAATPLERGSIVEAMTTIRAGRLNRVWCMSKEGWFGRGDRKTPDGLMR